MLKAVIMDFDGLIIDTEVVWYELYKDWFKKNKNYQLSVQEFLTCVGSQDEDLFMELEKKQKITVDRRQFKEEVTQGFIEQSNQLPPKEGVVDFIQAVKCEGLKLALATSATRKKPVSHLRRLGLMEYFDTIVTAEDVKRIKPFPDLFQEAARQLAIAPSEALVVEDSENGLNAGINAHMKVLVIPNEVTTASDFCGYYKWAESLRTVRISEIMAEFKEEDEANAIG